MDRTTRLADFFMVSNSSPSTYNEAALRRRFNTVRRTSADIHRRAPCSRELRTAIHIWACVPSHRSAGTKVRRSQFREIHARKGVVGNRVRVAKPSARPLEDQSAKLAVPGYRAMV